MASAKKQTRTPRRPEDREPSPYRASDAERAPLPPPDRLETGAVLIFLAIVVGPLLAVVGLPVAAIVARLAGLDPIVAAVGRLRMGAPIHVFEVLLSVMLLVGAHRITQEHRAMGISDELQGAARMFSFVRAATFTLIAVTFALGDWKGYLFFKPAGAVVRAAAEAAVTLTASRHFARLGSGRAARAGRWLAAALPAALVAEHVLTRTTYDEQFNPVPPRHANLVEPIYVAVWIGKLVFFWLLCRALARRADATPEESTMA